MSGTGIGRAGRGVTPLLLLAVSLLAPPALATGAPAGDDQPPPAARTGAISAADPRWLDRLPPLTLPLPRPDASADGDRAATRIAPVGMTTDPVAETAAPRTALSAPEPAPEPEPEPASIAPDPAPASPAPSEPEPAPAAAAPTPEPVPLALDPAPASPAPSAPQVAAMPETREPPAAIDPSAAADLDEALESEAASSIEVIDSLVFAGSAPDVATSAESAARIDPDAGDPKPPIPSPTAAARHTSSASSASSPSTTASDSPPPAGTDLSNAAAAAPVAPLASRYRWHVQILAGRSLELVKKDRDRFALRHARLLEGLTLTISRSKHTRRGSFYRLRATEWASRQAATDWCTRLSARGQDCLVIRVTP